MPGTEVPARVALFHGWAESPVWDRTPGGVGPVVLNDLPITEALRARLAAWNDDADRIKSAHGYEWPDAATEAASTAAGSRLAQDLRDQLGIEVVYAPDGVPEP